MIVKFSGFLWIFLDIIRFSKIWKRHMKALRKCFLSHQTFVNFLKFWPKKIQKTDFSVKFSCFFANIWKCNYLRVMPLKPLNRTSKVLQKSSKVYLIMWSIDRDICIYVLVCTRLNWNCKVFVNISRSYKNFTNLKVPYESSWKILSES